MIKVRMAQSLIVAVLMGAALAACSSNDPAPAANAVTQGGSGGQGGGDGDGDGNDGPTGNPGNRPPDAGGGAKVCSASCKEDSTCASQCSGTGTFCCDFPTGTCYQSATPQCVHAKDAGAGAPTGNPYP